MKEGMLTLRLKERKGKYVLCKNKSYTQEIQRISFILRIKMKVTFIKDILFLLDINKQTNK